MPAIRLCAPALLLLLAIVPRAHAEVHRCAAPDGTTIYTDRKCEDVGAVARLPAASGASGARLYRDPCSHTLQDLVVELTMAIDARDVNRLAGVYDWTGMSTAAGYATMDRLQVIAQRPLVDVSAVFPSGSGDADANYYPQAATRQPPIGLRLEQTLANGTTPARTVLGLRRTLGCWWIRL